MRVENIPENRSVVLGDLGVGPVLRVSESNKLDALNHDNDRNGQKDDDAQQKKRSALMEAMEVAEDHLKGTGLNIRLKVAENSERLQVEVFDPKTREVLRRFPPDEIIRLAESIDEMAGLLVDRSF